MLEAREAKARRELKKYGYMLKKSRARNWRLDNQLGYMIVMISCNVSVRNSANYSLSIDDVEDFLKDE